MGENDWDDEDNDNDTPTSTADSTAQHPPLPWVLQMTMTGDMLLVSGGGKGGVHRTTTMGTRIWGCELGMEPLGRQR
jgi:hypothetical protein